MKQSQDLKGKIQERLQRMMDSRQMGLFAVPALRIQHEELSDVLKEINSLEKAGMLHAEQLDSKVSIAWRNTWRRLILEGIVELSDDYVIMNMPWRDFVGQTG